jgi:hypothetical protein
MAIADHLAAIDSELAHIDGHIAALQVGVEDLLAQRRELRTRRNVIACAFCRLPVELVQKIADHLTSPAFDPPNDLSAQPSQVPRLRNVNGWTVVAGVCARLRAVLLDSRHLWARVFWKGRGTEWQDLCIERAGPVPLYINITVTTGHSHDYDFQPLSAWIVRARTLIVDMERSSHKMTGLNTLLEVIQQSAPLLHTFSYTGLRGQYDRCPTRLFMGGQTASLTRLMLAYTELLPAELRFPSLVHLDLYHCWFLTDHAVKELFALLAAAPRLERLLLSDVRIVLPVPGTMLQWQAPQMLPRLSYLGLSGDLILLRAFIPRLPIPMYGYIMNTDTRTGFVPDIRIQALDCAFTALGLPVSAYKTSAVPVLNLYQCRLVIERPGGPGSITYEDHCQTLDEFSAFLDHTRALRVHRSAFEQLFVYATTRSYKVDQALGALEHLVLQDFDSPLYDFSDWLAQRARAGRPLKLVDFCGKKSYVVRFGTVAELGRQMVEEGVVDQVLLDGQPLDI